MDREKFCVVTDSADVILKPIRILGKFVSNLAADDEFSDSVRGIVRILCKNLAHFFKDNLYSGLLQIT